MGTLAIAHFNSDSDDDFETAALIHCRQAVSQVVVYDRDAEGKIVLMGQVTAEGKDQSQRDIHYLFASLSGRTLMVNMSPPGVDISITQDREYSWDGSKFIQVGGPTS
jgi:hypothetical protein